MRRSRFVPVAALMGALAVVAGSCSDDEGGTTDTRVPTSTATSVEVTVVEDVRYDTGEVTTYATPPLMDVYAPPDAEGLPLVVLLHGGGADKDAFTVYDTLPRAIATRGAVVAVPNWNTGSIDMPQLLDGLALTRCAIGFAVEHAAEWGADPGSVTLVGHSAGANNAAVIGFGESPQPPGCAPVPWDVSGVVLWEGDWALADPSIWDEPGAGVAASIPVLTPWADLDGWSGPVTFVVTAGSASIRRCDDIDTWLPVRDPTGAIRAALDAVDAIEDGCIDPGDLSKALAYAMTGAGVATTYVDLVGQGSNHTQLSGDDVEILADEVYALTVPGG